MLEQPAGRKLGSGVADGLKLFEQLAGSVHVLDLLGGLLLSQRLLVRPELLLLIGRALKIEVEGRKQLNPAVECDRGSGGTDRVDHLGGAFVGEPVGSGVLSGGLARRRPDRSLKVAGDVFVAERVAGAQQHFFEHPPFRRVRKRPDAARENRAQLVAIRCRQIAQIPPDAQRPGTKLDSSVLPSRQLIIAQ